MSNDKVIRQHRKYPPNGNRAAIKVEPLGIVRERYKNAPMPIINLPHWVEGDLFSKSRVEGVAWTGKH